MFSTFNGSKLHYQIVGSGPHALLLFHGFGQRAQVFEALASSIAQTHTCYLFDLYFHGFSEWQNGEEPITKDLWAEIVARFLQEHNLDRFSVLGFSLGGKLALSAFESFPDRVDHLYLVASDGIKTSFWYRVATDLWLLRKLFKSTIEKPALFFRLASFFQKTGIVDKGLIRFASSQMNTVDNRKRVYYSWIIFRLLHFDMNKIGDLINRHDVNTVIVAGAYDKVIRPSSMNRLLKHLHQKKLIVVPTAHNGLLSPAVLGQHIR